MWSLWEVVWDDLCDRQIWAYSLRIISVEKLSQWKIVQKFPSHPTRTKDRIIEEGNLVIFLMELFKLLQNVFVWMLMLTSTILATLFSNKMNLKVHELNSSNIKSKFPYLFPLSYNWFAKLCVVLCCRTLYKHLKFSNFR